MLKTIYQKQNLDKILLKATLKEFGLNPTEWEIKKVRNTQYRINSKIEKGLSLLGIIDEKSQRPSWKRIFWQGI